MYVPPSGASLAVLPAALSNIHPHLCRPVLPVPPRFVPQEVYSFLNAATFATLTNVNFDDERFKEYVAACHALRDGLEVRRVLMGKA